MPRKPVEKTVEHRITLGTYERTLLSNAIKSEQKNDLQQSAISASGQVLGSAVGSGALLYAVALYLGYSVFDDAKNKVTDFIDWTSTGLSTVLTEVTGGLTANERKWFGARFDELDVLIVANRDRDKAHAQAMDVLLAQAKAGEISFDDFAVKAAIWNTENDLINVDRNDILEARQILLKMQNKAMSPSPAVQQYMKNLNGSSTLAYYITSTYPRPKY